MATLLNDIEIKRLFNRVILDADESCVRPNSYYIRLGNVGEFINSKREFKLGGGAPKKIGIRIAPGHSAVLTALETLDFSEEAIQSVFPGHALHAIVSPSTDLMREGIMAPTTQVDTGYDGTLNWTVNNTSSEERLYEHGERIFRLLIFKLSGKEEVPEKWYDGPHKGKRGLVRSERRQRVDIRDEQWESSIQDFKPETFMDHLVKSGQPWRGVGEILTKYDSKIAVIVEGNETMKDTLADIKDQLEGVCSQVCYSDRELGQKIIDGVRGESDRILYKGLFTSWVSIFGIGGLFLALAQWQPARDFFAANGIFVGILISITSFLILLLILLFNIRRK